MTPRQEWEHGRYLKEARKNTMYFRALTEADFVIQLSHVYNNEPLDFPLARISRAFPNFQRKCNLCLRNNINPEKINLYKER